jgi:hypothetical protein
MQQRGIQGWDRDVVHANVPILKNVRVMRLAAHGHCAAWFEGILQIQLDVFRGVRRIRGGCLRAGAKRQE